jgi:hypothetical protein
MREEKSLTHHATALGPDLVEWAHLPGLAPYAATLAAM